MKKIIQTLAICLLFCITGYNADAQTEVEIEANGRSYSQIFDSLSTGLIPSRIPYGILYDRVFGWSGLDTWTSGDTASVSRLFQSWYDAEHSVINPLLRPNNYDSMRTVVQQQLFELKLPVMAIRYQFAYIDSTATMDGRLSVVNGILTDNQGASPYLTKNVTLAGIGTDKVRMNKSYALQYSNFLTLNNTGTAIQNIVVNNISQGIQYTLTADIPQSIQFTQSGENILKFTVNGGGNAYLAYQIVNVENDGTGPYYRPMGTAGANCTPTNELLESTIPFKGYDEGVATNSFADYHIYYHTLTPGGDCKQVLRKPIIILDGFDPGDDRQYNELFEKFLVNKDNGALLGSQLRDKGYDVIILNFPKLGQPINGQQGEPDISIPSSVKINGTTQTVNREGRDGGADYIERNAFLLVKLIQQVNQTLANNGSTEKIVVVGPSIGGLISRYALAYMEKKQAEGVPGMDHNCRLWISFDSPHEGANIPLALQENLSFFGNTGQIQAAKDKFQSNLRNPAARQMLIEQTDGMNGSSTYFTTFYNGLKANGVIGSNGFPVNLRKVALLNGTGSGTGTYAPGTEILNGVAWSNFLNLKVFEVIDNFLPSPGQSSRIVKQRVTLKGFLYITFITHQYSPTNTNTRGSMDAVPGGTFNATQEVYEGFYEGLTHQSVHQTWMTKNFYHTSIPTISALGFKNSSFNWNTRVDNRNLVCKNEIYFDNYYFPTSNQEHIFLNTDNIDWIIAELDANPLYPPGNYVISGDNSFCTISNPYTISGMPAGSAVTWSATPSGVVAINSPNAPQTTLTKIGSGSFTLSAVISTNCGSLSAISKSNIKVGISPSIDNAVFLVSGPSCVNSGAVSFGVKYNGSSGCGLMNRGVTEIEWNVMTNYPYAYQLTYNAGQYACSGVNNAGLRMTFSKAVTQPYIVTLLYRVKNACGWSQWSPGNYYFLNPCSGNRSFNVFPNPTNGILNISMEDQSLTKSKTGIRAIVISDKLGNMIKRYNYANTSKNGTSVDVSNLKADIYFIKVFDGFEWRMQSFIKN